MAHGSQTASKRGPFASFLWGGVVAFAFYALVSIRSGGFFDVLRVAAFMAGFCATLFAAWKLYERQRAYHLKHFEFAGKFADVHGVGGLVDISPREFEEFVDYLYGLMGYKTELTPDGPDDGIDVFAEKGGVRFGIQAKHYKDGHTVGSPDIHKLHGSCAHKRCSEGICITNSRFTERAFTAAKACKIQLIDGEDLDRLIKLYNPLPHLRGH